MNVLLLAPHPFYEDRGSPIAVRYVLRGLSERGERVDVVTYHVGKPICYPNVTLHRIARLPFIRSIPPGPSWKKLVCDLFLFAKAMRLASTKQYDLVHAVEEAGLMAVVIKKIFGTPYIYDMDSSIPTQIVDHYPFLRPLRGVMRYFERISVQGAETVLPMCDALAVQAGRYDPKRVAVLRDVSLLDGHSVNGRVGLRETCGIQGLLVMYVGNLAQYQGMELLLQSFARTLQHVQDANLVVVGGSASDIRKYEARCAAIGIRHRVYFLGPQSTERLAECLDAADLLVSPRIKGENTPMKIYSYLHSGKAVLATDLVTHTQLLDRTVAVLAAPSVEAFSGQMIRLLKDRGLREQLGAAGKRLIEARYTYRVLRESLDRVYDRLAAERRPRKDHAARAQTAVVWRDGVENWAVRLFNKSSLKQQKFRALTAMLGRTEGLRCLDIGSDNGVISYLLRQRGGTWKSADLEPETVEAIRRLVGSEVYQIDGRQTPFQDNEFDRVVVVDFLEHIHTDREFVDELFRIVRPGGEVIVNVPYLKHGLLQKLRTAVVQTDEEHGHVRPGYTVEEIATLLKGTFTIQSWNTYVRPFSEAIDLLITLGVKVVKQGTGPSRKGLLVLGEDLERHRRLFWLYSLLYPVVWCLVKLDALLFWCAGSILIVRAASEKPEAKA